MIENQQLTQIATELIQKNAKNILSFIKDNVEERIKISSVEFSNAFSKFLIKSIEKYGEEKTLLYRYEPVELNEFYVNMDLKYKNILISSDSIDNLLDINKFLIITGTGGIGKSTLLKYLFLNTIEESEKNNLIPIFVKLRDLNNGENNLIDCIYSSLSILGFNLEKNIY